MATNMNYGGLGGTFGIPAQELQDLSKALGSGQLVDGSLGAAYADGGAALRVQSLESVLKVVTYQDRNIVFWKDVPKLQAYNTSEEYNRLISYGGGGSGFMQEGGLPGEDTSVYERRVQLIKMMGQTGSVSHLMSLVNPAHGDVIGREVKNRTMSLMKQVEMALYFGNSSINAFAFDGLEAQIKEDNILNVRENIIDLRGSALDEDVMQDISRIVADEYGMLTHFYAGQKAISDLGKQLFPNARFTIPYGDNYGSAGYPLRTFDAQCGTFEIKSNVFLKPGGPVKATADIGAPDTPVITSAVAGAATGSKFDANATLYYKIAALNNNGESLATAATNVSVVAGDGVTITIASVPTGALAYKIYRGNSATDIKEMVTVKAVAGVIHIDKNDDLPGTSKAFGVMLDAEQGLAFKQLAPLSKVDLATIAASYRFMILLYGTLAIYAPQKMIMIKNIGNL